MLTNVTTLSLDWDLSGRGLTEKHCNVILTLSSVSLLMFLHFQTIFNGFLSVYQQSNLRFFSIWNYSVKCLKSFYVWMSPISKWLPMRCLIDAIVNWNCEHSFFVFFTNITNILIILGTSHYLSGVVGGPLYLEKVRPRNSGPPPKRV